MKFFLICSLALFVSACSHDRKEEKRTSEELTATSVVPAAEGEVRTKMDRNGNTQLNVNVKHLAEPSKLNEGANSYVVWIMPMGQTTYQNVGALKVNENLEGTMETKVPHKNFNLIVTPEPSYNAQAPTGVTVMEKAITL